MSVRVSLRVFSPSLVTLATFLLAGISTHGQSNPVVGSSGANSGVNSVADSGAKSGQLPSVKDVLERSLRATGGGNWLQLTSLHVKADVADRGNSNFRGKLDMYTKAPDKISECVTFPMGIFICRGYDGKAGWNDDSKDGLTNLDGPRLHEIQGEGDFYVELHREKTFASMRVKGEDVFDNVPVYVLEGTLRDGRKDELYFAKDSGFEVGSKELGDPASNPKTNHLSDYKELAGVGVKIPTKTRIVQSNMDLLISIYEVIPNPKIADSAFAKPEKSARDSKGSGIGGRPDNGKVVSGVYANQFFGFQYSVPQGWTVHGEETQRVLTETGKELVAGDDESRKRMMEAAEKRSFHLLTVFEYPLGTPNKVNRGVQVMAENVGFAPGIQTGRDYLLLMAKGLATSQLHASFEGEPVKESIDGIDFYRQDVDLQVAGRPVHELFYSTVEKGYALSFLFTAQDKERAEDAAKSLSSVRKLTTTASSAQPGQP